MSREDDEVTIEKDGRTYRARWYVEKGVITVMPEDGQPRSTKVGNTPPVILARQMLGEYVNGAS